MRYVLIDASDKVVNVFYMSEERIAEWECPETLRVRPSEDAQVGWTFKNCNFLAPAPAPQPSANEVLLSQIAVLEAQQTPRRFREAVKDPTWINALDEQIAALRAQLTNE